MREGWKELLPRSWAAATEQRVHMDSPEAGTVLAEAICGFGLSQVQAADGLILLCVGTDRSNGDALGPLIGSQLTEAGDTRYLVLGTLDDPVHAGNLAETVSWIESRYRTPLVVAVDACLGRTESIGMLSVGKGSLRPGAGVNKTLPAVGQVYVTGVVNVGGFMEYFVLQNTRLSLVMRMAKVAARGIGAGLARLAEAREQERAVGPFG